MYEFQNSNSEPFIATSSRYHVVGGMPVHDKPAKQVVELQLVFAFEGTAGECHILNALELYCHLATHKHRYYYTCHRLVVSFFYYE